MKRILYDLYESQPAASTKFHGGGEYIKAIFKYITENYMNDIELIVFYNRDKYMDSWILDMIRQNNIKEYFITQRSDIQTIFENEEIDVFYSGLPYYYKREYIPEKVKIIGTIHGLRFVELPADKYAHYYARGFSTVKEYIRLFIKNRVRNAKLKEFCDCIDMLDEVICITNHTFYAIKKWVNPQKEIHVFCPPMKNAQLCEKKESPFREKFILLIGGDRWVKNVYRAILAMETLFSAGMLPEYKVVIVGGINGKIRRAMHHHEKYEIMEYVETDDLESLYKFCDLFLYPSLNEGFGIPPLEAMRYGRTCIISGVCSLPEVYGDAVYYVNPYDVDEIAVRVLEAAAEKIPECKVSEQFEKVLSKQQKGLEGVSKFIIQ